MATYATQEDFANYVEGWVTSNPDALERILVRAEDDIDRLLASGSFRTNAVIGIGVSPGITGGQFELNLTWRGVQYTSEPILWNDTGANAVLSLQGMMDSNGMTIPPGVWSIPEAKYYSQAWAYGPLPNIPVVVEAMNTLGRQALPDITVVNNTLIPTGSQALIQTIVSGGRRANPYMLPISYADALRNATCAQAEYRITMGEEFFVRAQYSNVSGPEFRTQGKLPMIGPKVERELQGTDLMQRGARARPGSATSRQSVYFPIGTTPIPDDWRSV